MENHPIHKIPIDTLVSLKYSNTFAEGATETVEGQFWVVDHLVQQELAVYRLATRPRRIIDKVVENCRKFIPNADTLGWERIARIFDFLRGDFSEQNLTTVE